MFEEKSARTELSSIGEFGLINHISKSVKLTNATTVKGIGDDAAVISESGNETNTVVTTDMLVEGVHFDLSYVPLKHLGYKAVAVNVSDVCAMNAEAKQITVSVALSNRFSIEAVEELYSGILLACERYGVDLVGGDTTSSLSGLIISITAVGITNKADVVYRSGAREKNLICVTGDLGAAYMGLQILEREKTIFKDNPNVQPDLAGNDYILERQLKPEARIEVIKKLKEFGIKPTAMIDVSDGLASEILHICTQSNVGCELYEDKLPIDLMTNERAHEFKLDPTTCALNGGEDYELLFTIDIADFEKIKNYADVTVIGHITEVGKGMLLVTRSGTVHEITAQGWDALLKK
jgi:thiamine-monophosphate kinase